MHRFLRCLFFVFMLLWLSMPLCGFAKECKDRERELRSYFKDLLLIVNFNHPYYGNIEFLKEIYSPYFANIVFYGEQPHPGVNVVSEHLGWFGHRVISDAMQRWPGYKGYICCQDDCFMNFWKFVRLDKDKIWMHQYWTASLNDPKHWWPWWNMPCGHAAAVQAYRRLPQINIETLEKNCGSAHFAFTWADFVYIPQRYRESFIALSKLFDAPDVFVEITVPTILLSLVEFDKMEKMIPFWGGIDSANDLVGHNATYDWVHPVKFSNGASREAARRLIAETFSCQH